MPTRTVRQVVLNTTFPSALQLYQVYIMFIDFKKAYDKVPRAKLAECLKQRGCGHTMLLPIQAVYS